MNGLRANAEQTTNTEKLKWLLKRTSNMIRGWRTSLIISSLKRLLWLASSNRTEG